MIASMLAPFDRSFTKTGVSPGGNGRAVFPPLRDLYKGGFLGRQGWIGAITRRMSPTQAIEIMLNDIYNKRIIELAGNIPRLGRLPDPDASATAHSKLCGSTVKVDIKMDGAVVTDFAHDVKACALGQASSSIMARHVIGSNAAELRDLRETVRRMLKEDGAPPQGKWADIALLEPVRDYKARHASTMLTFDAVVDAIGQVEAKARTPAAAQN
jgi:NifU-like protein involved in Fe-S cluster formation